MPGQDMKEVKGCRRFVGGSVECVGLEQLLRSRKPL